MLFPDNKNASRNTILQNFRVNSYNKYFLLTTGEPYDANYHVLSVGCPTQQTANRSFEAIASNSERQDTDTVL